MLPTHHTLPIPIQNQKLDFPQKNNLGKGYSFQPPPKPGLSPAAHLISLLLFSPHLLSHSNIHFLVIPRYSQLGLFPPPFPPHASVYLVIWYPQWTLHRNLSQAEIPLSVGIRYILIIQDVLIKGLPPLGSFPRPHVCYVSSLVFGMRWW